jgi:hypothetical protein
MQPEQSQESKMTVHSNPPARRVNRVIAASLATGIGLAFMAAPAFADSPWNHDGWHHERWEHEYRHHHRWHRDDDGWRRGYVYGYAPPPVYYAPPPVYYAPPPPVYFGPPSVSFGVNIPLNH